VIKNGCTSLAVNSHVLRLRGRRHAENADEAAAFFDKRIKSLSPNHVVIRLPDDKDFVKNSQTIDYVLRAYSELLKRGTVNINDSTCLTSTFLGQTIYASRCLEQLKSFGAVLT
jgi:hypothetical protein